tara:strand:+ start:5494 stop:6555 length:1062 start_codon:yes stop_codon:yes gene_type:complete
MPSFNTPLTCDDVKANKIDLGNLRLSSNGKYISVRSGDKEVFWVDDNGANIQALETKTNFVSLTDCCDALGANGSVLMVSDEKVGCSKQLHIDSLKADSLSGTKLDVQSCNIGSLISKSVLAETATLDKLCSDEVTAISLKAGDLTAKRFKCNDFITDVLKIDKSECKQLVADEISSNSCVVTNVMAVNGNIESLKSQNVTILNLNADQTNGGSGNFDKVTAKEVQTNKLKVVEMDGSYATLIELQVQRLNIKYETYGLMEAPLFLAISQMKELALNPSSYHKIITRVPAHNKSQTFTMTGVSTRNDWKVSVSLTKDNEVQPTLVVLDTHLKLNLTYKKTTEEDTLAIIYLQC